MTPSIRYINQSAPFWDFIASFEEQAENVAEHPFFARTGGSGDEGGPQGPWGRHRGGRHHGRGGPFAHRGRQEPQAPVPDAEGEESSPATARGDKEMGDDAIPDPPEETPEQQTRDGCGGRRQWGGRCGGGRGARGFGHHGPHGHHGPFGPFGPHGPHGPHGHHGGPRGGPGGFGGFPMGGRGFNFLSEIFQPQEAADQQGDFKPEVDVFDTESTFVVHVSLPGAQKDDIGVAWDAEKSELSITGVVHRPGDEELLKTLAMDERKVGAFERKVRLGTRAHPAQIDVDGISAKLDNGILLVEVPKLNGEFVEIKKVDIE